ncbi:hypothetical protein [Spartinivicinus ruber]|uniref:hypothetical protein n=1 Tax=Spartinivicinus ruber TaxID=2683272 RepID=UPI0013CF64B0|nr:hypothetical protein [Spartinivicinus ruber]
MLVSLKCVSLGSGTNVNLFATLLSHVGGAGNIEITLTGTFKASSTRNAAL